MIVNLFPRIVVFEVNLTPPQIMQAIHDNINNETSFLNTIFNSKRLEGTTSGKEFDVNLTNEESFNKANQIFLHGEIKELENGFTEIEISCYPYPRLFFGLIAVTIMLFVFLTVLFPLNKIPIQYEIIAKLPVFIAAFTIAFYLLSWFYKRF
jgi:hypothetical protein